MDAGHVQTQGVDHQPFCYKNALKKHNENVKFQTILILGINFLKSFFSVAMGAGGVIRAYH